MALDFITALRENHALEHATVALLMGKLRPGTRLLGRATTGGFHIYGDVPSDAVAEAADEGLARLKRGEHDLAVSPLCGTNLVVTAVLAGTASMLAARGRSRTSSLPNVLLAALTAVMLAQPLGRLAQKHLTTTPHLSGVTIGEVTSTGEGRHTRHRIRTLRR